MEELLKEEKIASLRIHPDVVLKDKDRQVYHLRNKLIDQTTGNPTILFPDGDPKQAGYIYFSAFVENVAMLPTAPIKGTDGKVQYVWRRMHAPGIFALKDDEGLNLDLPIGDDGKIQPARQDKMQKVRVKIDPDWIFVDIYTLCIMDDTDYQLIKSPNNACLLERFTYREPKEGLETRQDFRRAKLIEANDLILKEFTAWQARENQRFPGLKERIQEELNKKKEVPQQFPPGSPSVQGEK